jgi:CNT family concentrative nucleoside transporter
MLQVTSGIGLMVMILIAWLLSSDRKRFPWRVVSGGVALQFVLAILLLKTPQGRELFQNVNQARNSSLVFSEMSRGGH